jgi:catechol 2,3-dioxygenase
MTRVPHKAFNYNEHRGGTAMRFDHFQLQVPDVDAAWRNYAAMGFRTSEYIRTPDGRAFAIFLHRKDASWDFVIVANTGPRLHHVGFITASLTKIFDAGDVAGRSGLGRIAEYGPGTHPGGHGRFVYFRDPDGHRVELVLAPPHHRMDMDSHVPVDFSTVPGAEWHFPAQEKWWAEATEFSATKAKAPDEPFSYRTLEGFLSQQKAAAR